MKIWFPFPAVTKNYMFFTEQWNGFHSLKLIHLIKRNPLAILTETRSFSTYYRVLWQISNKLLAVYNLKWSRAVELKLYLRKYFPFSEKTNHSIFVYWKSKPYITFIMQLILKSGISRKSFNLKPLVYGFEVTNSTTFVIILKPI